VRNVAKVNEYLFVEFSHGGGHVGWVAGQPWAARYYMEDRVVKWLAEGK
jgi:predicted alpha/beta-fold hydrolase